MFQISSAKKKQSINAAVKFSGKKTSHGIEQIFSTISSSQKLVVYD